MSEPKGRSSVAFDGTRLSLTIAPDTERGVSLERFVAALWAANDLLTTMNPESEPVLCGGHADGNGAVTIEAGPSPRVGEDREALCEEAPR